jgi:hypothetical protein
LKRLRFATGIKSPVRFRTPFADSGHVHGNPTIDSILYSTP